MKVVQSDKKIINLLTFSFAVLFLIHSSKNVSLSVIPVLEFSHQNQSQTLIDT
jgi:hypothetical protein